MHKRGTQLSRKGGGATVQSLSSALERLAPKVLAQSWDNVGLLVGDPKADVRTVLLCIDMTPDVVAEAVSTDAQFILAYHPPLFKPISRLLADSRGTDAQLHDCIAHRIAIYSLHTALDAAEGGTNDVLAELCGIKSPRPIEVVEAPGAKLCKLVVFIPETAVEEVADAMAGAGAGVIGQYQRCSFRTSGQGTFQGSEASRPTVGKAGVFETVEEIRLEMVVTEHALAAAVQALRSVHPYEEPAFDIYPLQRPPAPGIGRWGLLPTATKLATLARKLKHGAHANTVQIVGEKSTTVRRAVIVAGAGGGIPFKVGLNPGDVVITGEMRHHDALSILRNGATAIVLNHWSSERPVLDRVAERLTREFSEVRFVVSAADAEPFSAI